MDNLDFLKKQPDNSYDLIFSDPWYGIGSNRELTGFAKNRFSGGDLLEPDEPPPEEFFREVLRVGKVVEIWGGNYFLDNLGKCVAPRIWNKKTGGNRFADGEFCWTSLKTGTMRIFEHQWCGVFKDSERREKRIHTCKKPVALYKWQLSMDAKPGMKILDTHCGSGSMRLACYDMGLDYEGLEHNEEIWMRQEFRFEKYKRDVDSQPGLIRNDDELVQAQLFGGE
jgi:site-specific DNA-methyltransferase (adenine-specific)